MALRAPLTIRSFDPLNLIMLADQRLLHDRYLRFGNEMLEGELLGRPCTTRSSGNLWISDIEEVRVTGLEAVRLYDGGRRLEAEGLTVSASTGQWYAERGLWRYRE
ncbi:hypothetical protein MF271_08295 [Deinococcus sp. KNUC1210]|uniref:hypothetical protein n=1 Tax=Deinococcus sp. KNUC1210 TaxID=2917691 RepID=UPI001EF11B9B|nr:hypothetical protein [Deinococcus sp. KNUC1210]ULH16559.1 hypothetical protein MF271_08295 [Deinococcus sp. KNUC1210]